MPRPSETGLGGGGYKTYGSTNVFPTPGVGFSGSQFSPTEFYQLCDSITTNIYTINHSGASLEETLKVVGTNKDNLGLRDKVHVTQMSTNQIIAQTTQDLRRLNVVVKRGDRQQKLQVEKLTNDFQQSVQQYSNFQKQVARKMKSHLIPQHKSPESEVVLEGQDEVSDAQKLIETEKQRHTQMQLQQEAEFERDLLVERANRIQRIEADILDVNHIMKELGSMVHEQGKVVNSIENHMESTQTAVEGGRGQLEKAYEYQSKYRKKLCIFIVILVIIAGIIAIVLATQLSGS